MLATAPLATAPINCLLPQLTAPRLRPQLTVSGRVCSTPVLHWTSTGVAVAHFRLLCDFDASTDARVRALADRGTSIIDVTVWRTNAVLAAGHHDAMNPARYRAIKDAEKAGQHSGWRTDRHWVRQVRLGARVTVEGTPRAGRWLPARHPSPLPFGLLTEQLPRGAAVG